MGEGEGRWAEVSSIPCPTPLIIEILGRVDFGGRRKWFVCFFGVFFFFVRATDQQYGIRSI